MDDLPTDALQIMEMAKQQIARLVGFIVFFCGFRVLMLSR